MVKTLTQIGNSLGLILDRPILELLGITRDTPLEIRTDGIGLVIRPVTGEAAAQSLRGSVRYQSEEDLIGPTGESWEADG